MKKPFSIYFNFQLEGTEKVICIKATVQFDPDGHSYTVHSFQHFDGVKKSNRVGILPDIKIRQRPGTNTWVHVDSDSPSILSSLVGQAIEKVELVNG